MTDLGDAIAESVLAKFYQLPSKAKPRRYSEVKREWTPLSGVVLSKDGHDGYTCISLGTGMRCLPSSKISLAKGRCLHDWHAEIVAIRAFNRFLLDECASLANNPATTSLWIRRRRPEEIREDGSRQPFAIEDDVHIDMYCSEAPCGDASMELVMDSQTDATPWAITVIEGPSAPALKGRGNFSELGIVRRKPARADAPSTKSKSCSDKLALKQTISLLSSTLSLLVHPGNVYLQNLVLPSLRCNSDGVGRAFSASGRMSHVDISYDNKQLCTAGYSFRPFKVRQTTKEFEYSRNGLGQTSNLTGSNIAAMWTPLQCEVLIGGTVQGNRQFSERGSSVISRMRVWQAALEVAHALADSSLVAALDQPTYLAVKQNAHLALRRMVKKQTIATALAGWVVNDGDEDFTLHKVL